MRMLPLTLTIGLSLFAGCRGGVPDGGTSLELTGQEVQSRLPAEVAALLTDDVVLCLDAAGHDGDFRQWLLRRPEGGRLEFPPTLPGLEGHDAPLSALTAIWRSRLPGVAIGEPRERRCRLTHWRSGPREEIQVREILTDAGWFASVERVRM